MNRNKNFSPNKQSQVFDIMLSQQDYQKVLQAKNLYQNSLKTNKQLQSELQTYKLNFLTLKKQGEQLIKKVMKLAKRIIILEEENQRFKDQKQQMTKQTASLLAENKKLFESIKQMKTNTQIQDQCIKQFQKLTAQLTQKNKNYSEIQNQNTNLQCQNQKYQFEVESLEKEVEKIKDQIEKHKTEKLKLTEKNEYLCAQYEKLNAQHRELMTINTYIEEFFTKMTDNIKSIMQIIPTNETQNQQQVFQGSSINQNDQVEQGEEKKELSPIEIFKSIIMDDKNSFIFIEQSLNSITIKINEASISIKQLRQQNINLQAENETLKKRIKIYKDRCQDLQIQMSLQLNIQKVIQHKYEGLKEISHSSQNIHQTMQEVIKKYHDALDNIYLKILEKMFNQQ